MKHKLAGSLNGFQSSKIMQDLLAVLAAALPKAKRKLSRILEVRFPKAGKALAAALTLLAACAGKALLSALSRKFQRGEKELQARRGAA